MNDTVTAPQFQTSAMADTAPQPTRRLPQAQRSPNIVAAARQPTLLDLLKSERVEKALTKVAGDILRPQRLVSLVVNAIAKTPKIALCDPKSVLGCMMVAQNLQLEPNTPAGLAYLIPRNSRGKNPETGRWEDRLMCNIELGYRGYITLAHRSQAILSVKAEAIREGDTFRHVEGFEDMLTFEKSLRGGRGHIIGAFAFSRHPHSVNVASVLTYEDIMKARARSETYRALTIARDRARTQEERARADKALAETPWVMWEDQMAAKTAIRSHLTRLPIWDQPSSDLMSAAALDDATTEGRADLSELGAAAERNPDEARAMLRDEAPMPEREPPPEPPPSDDDWVPPAE